MNNQLNLFKNCFDGIGYQFPIQLTLTTNNDIVSYSISQPNMRNIKLYSGSFRARQCKRTSKRFVSAIQVQQRLTKKIWPIDDRINFRHIYFKLRFNISTPPPHQQEPFLNPGEHWCTACIFCYRPVSTVTLFPQHCKAENRHFNASSKQFILSAFSLG